jgi:hypothetical protein
MPWYPTGTRFPRIETGGQRPVQRDKSVGIRSWSPMLMRNESSESVLPVRCIHAHFASAF